MAKKVPAQAVRLPAAALQRAERVRQALLDGRPYGVVSRISVVREAVDEGLKVLEDRLGIAT